MVLLGHARSAYLRLRPQEVLPGLLVELTGTEPEINDTTTYDNNVKIVPSYLLIPYTVTADNYQELVMDSGYLTADDIK